MSTDMIKINNKFDWNGLWGSLYVIVGVLIGVVSFFGIWIYAFNEWGLLVGLAIGWLPAIIGAFIIGFTWPLIVCIAILLFLYTINH